MDTIAKSIEKAVNGAAPRATYFWVYFSCVWKWLGLIWLIFLCPLLPQPLRVQVWGKSKDVLQFCVRHFAFFFRSDTFIKRRNYILMDVDKWQATKTQSFFRCCGWDEHLCCVRDWSHAHTQDPRCAHTHKLWRLSSLINRNIIQLYASIRSPNDQSQIDRIDDKENCIVTFEWRLMIHIEWLSGRSTLRWSIHMEHKTGERNHFRCRSVIRLEFDVASLSNAICPI